MAKKPQLIKKVKNAALFDGHLIRIEDVRFSYPHLASAYAGEDGGKPAFSVTGLMSKATHEEAKDLIQDAIKALLKENKDAKVGRDKRCLKDGDDSEKPENEGCWTVSARETKRPKVRDQNGDILEADEIEDVIYGGCYGDLIIRLWFQDNKYGKRVNANLVSVKFRRDGEPFGEGRVDDGDLWDEDDGGSSGFDDDDDDL